MSAQLTRRGLMIAAPSSGSGKTLFTLALLRALKNRNHSVGAAKAGPDYIDPAFHEIACGVPSVNLDPWAMDEDRLRQLAYDAANPDLLIEAMMGLFDGAADGTGSAADLARCLGIPVLLVVNTAKQSQSIAALVRGFRDHRPEVRIAGVILNKVGSIRHEAMLRKALAEIDLPVLGAVPRDENLVLPERHLGLVQAGELDGIEAFVERAAGIVENTCDLDEIVSLQSPVTKPHRSEENTAAILPLGQRIAIARDRAFSFIYPHLLNDWKKAGVTLSFFSPLANEAPAPDADAIYLPGGYPELHAGILAYADRFKASMRDATKRNLNIYGECGGYMVLGKGIVGADGSRHEMLGLLDMETSFEKRKLHLGYRIVEGLAGEFSGKGYCAHEFHYTSATRENGEALFSARDALGNDLGRTGLCDGTVSGSYMHLIDRRAQ